MSAIVPLFFTLLCSAFAPFGVVLESVFVLILVCCFVLFVVSLPVSLRCLGAPPVPKTGRLRLASQGSLRMSLRSRLAHLACVMPLSCSGYDLRFSVINGPEPDTQTSRPLAAQIRTPPQYDPMGVTAPTDNCPVVFVQFVITSPAVCIGSLHLWGSSQAFA